MMCAKGDLLISEPFLNDPNFARSVILLCEHNADGSLGFVLNHPSSLILEDVGDEFNNFDSLVYIGGPVAHDTLHFVHTLGEKIENSVKINDYLYWSGDLDRVKELLRLGIMKEHDIRFFLGYSGWGAGQLDAEFKSNTWIGIKSYDEDIMKIDSKNLWREILKSQGGKYKEMANYPVDPRLN